MSAASGDFSDVRWVFDSGHGWLRVPMVSAEGLEFSEYSYIDRAAGVLYLEEDCDAWVWWDAHGLDRAKDGFPIEWACDRSGRVVDDCWVRNLPRIPAAASA